MEVGGGVLVCVWGGVSVKVGVMDGVRDGVTVWVMSVGVNVIVAVSVIVGVMESVAVAVVSSVSEGVNEGPAVPVGKISVVGVAVSAKGSKVGVGVFQNQPLFSDSPRISKSIPSPRSSSTSWMIENANGWITAVSHGP